MRYDGEGKFKPGTMFVACLLAATFLIGSGSATVFAQPDAHPYRVEVRLIQIEVRVTRSGHPVSDLKKEDFFVKENGVPQTIRFFEYVPGNVEWGSPPGQELLLDTTSHANAAARKPSAATESRRPSPTWVYLVPEVKNPSEFSQTAKGIRNFILNRMQPGFLISLGGLPFTDDRDLLLATLDRMQSAPFGNSEVRPAVSTELARMTDLQYQRHVAKAFKDETEWLATIAGVDREGDFKGPLDRLPPLAAETVDRQIAFLGELALLRYLDLVEHMSLYPGKKVIVLFRAGLQLDTENHEMMTRIAAAAGRNRVSFYTIDSRGLATTQPIEDRRYSLAWDSGREHNYFPKTLRQAERDRRSREGLEVLAKETNGRAVADTNDLGEILYRVADDASDYYVLGYYPEDLSETGRFRKVSVSVALPGAKIDAPRGYFENKPYQHQNRNERLLSLHRALDTESSNYLPIKGEIDLFATSDGQAVALFSLGISLQHLDYKAKADGGKVEADILARISDSVSHKLPLYQHGQINHTLTQPQLSAARKDPTLFLTYNSQCPVTAGLYQWKAVVRDALSGKFGVVKAKLDVPDFSQPSTPSSILLTRYLKNLGNIDRDNPVSEILTVKDRTYLPQPTHLFRLGDTIHLLFFLYHPTHEDIKVASRGMQIGLTCDGSPVTDVQAYGLPIIDRGADVIRYTAAIETAGLEPGHYTLLAILPNYRHRKIPHLEDHFTLLPESR